MKTGNYIILSIVIATFIFSACSKDEIPNDFQTNHSVEFELMEIFNGHGAVEDAWNSIDPEGLNERLERAINNNLSEFEIYSLCFADILEDPDQTVPELVRTDLKNTFSYLLDTKTRYQPKYQIGSFYNKSGDVYADGFYSFMDNMTGDGIEVPDSYFNIMAKKPIDYLLDSIPEDGRGGIRKAWLNEEMDDIIEDLLGNEFQDDFIDLSKTLSKLLMRTDYPMWIDEDQIPLNHDEIDPEIHINLDLGNAVKGTPEIIMWLNRIIRDDDTRANLHAAVQELSNIFDPDPESGVAEKFRDLLCNIEDHLTKGGTEYESNPIYHTRNEEIYSDAELGEVIREVFPHVMQLLMRSDRSNSMIADKNGEKIYPLKKMLDNLKALQWDPEETDIERSINHLTRYDIFGRNRETDPDAYHTSHLEHFLFFASVSSNMGYDDGGITGEITDITNANFSHGHGEFVGSATLNDSLYAMKTSETLGFGMYDLSFKSEDKNHLYRCRKPFNIANKEDYRFYFDQNYKIGLFLGGTPGDMGSPEGGISLKDESGEPILNSYRAYCPTGFMDDNIALNTVTGAIRCCWTAEGPFYYASSNAPTIFMPDDGKTYNVYYSPTGTVYAYVHKPDNGSDNWEYYYPVDGDQAYEDHVYFAGRPRKKMTHALFISNVDLTNGVTTGIIKRKIKIQMGNPEDPDIDVEVSFTLNKYYQSDVVNKINEAVGETVCFPYNMEGKKYVQIMSPYGPMTIINEVMNPIAELLVSDSKIDASHQVAVNSFTVTGKSFVGIQIDDETEEMISFHDEELNLWSVEKITNVLLSSDIARYVTPYRKAIIIKGESSDPNVAGVKIVNIPGSSVNGVETFFGGNGNILLCRLMREERYKTVFQTDFYMGRLNEFGTNKYYSIGRDHKGNMEIVDIQDGMARSVVLEQFISEIDPVRACTSPEEALLKNYQWFFAERKFIMVIPLHLSIPIVGGDLGIVYQVIETNGYAGFMNVRKFKDNHVWVKKGTDGDSDIPGDFRVEVVANTIPVVDLILTGDMIYNDIIDYGAAFTGILAACSPSLYRLGFPAAPKINHGIDANGNMISDYLLGPREFEVGDEIWENRNGVLTLLIALLGGLHDRTQLDGYNPQSAGVKQVIEMLPVLIQPLLYYQKDTGDFPRKAYKPRLIDGHYYLKSSADLYNNANPIETWYGSEDERRYFLPAVEKTLVNMLIDSDVAKPSKRNNGVLSLLTETKTLTHLLKVLLSDVSDSVELFYAIEQIASAIKFSKGEFTKINEGVLSDQTAYQSIGSSKNIKFPDWMFAKGIESTRDIYGAYTEFNNVRTEDLILDEALDSIIGHDEIDESHSGYGLASYPDDRLYDEDWEEFNDAIDIFSHLLHQESEFTITQSFLDMLDRTLGKDRPYTSDEITGLQYSLGKLFAYYDSDANRWVFQGEDEFNNLYNILRLRLPVIHEIISLKEQDFISSEIEYQPGDNYYAQLVIMSNVLMQDGLVEFLLNTVTVPWSWDKIFFDLDRFLESDLIILPDSPLWPTLANLLEDMGKAAGDAEGGVLLDGLYEEYGFQIN